ncbi:MAG TPA: protein tyrosine phosphatase family protein [Puia sp.]|nr:protein tyrosine phosphatase family protein [Puia sp.]
MEDIKNYLRISDRLACAGQPDELQLTKIAANGFEVVINLGLSDGKYALPDEATSITGLGLAYYHIPVLFESPQLAELASFMAIMDQHRDKKTLVHCAANYRAVAFSGLYLFAKSEVDEEGLRAFIEQIWNPNPVWQQFIEEASQRIKDNDL